MTEPLTDSRCQGCGGPPAAANCPRCDPRPIRADRAAGCICPGHIVPIAEWQPVAGCPVHLPAATQVPATALDWRRREWARLRSEGTASEREDWAVRELAALRTRADGQRLEIAVLRDEVAALRAALAELRKLDIAESGDGL